MGELAVGREGVPLRDWKVAVHVSFVASIFGFIFITVLFSFVSDKKYKIDYFLLYLPPPPPASHPPKHRKTLNSVHEVYTKELFGKSYKIFRMTCDELVLLNYLWFSEKPTVSAIKRLFLNVGFSCLGRLNLNLWLDSDSFWLKRPPTDCHRKCKLKPLKIVIGQLLSENFTQKARWTFATQVCMFRYMRTETITSLLLA